MKTKVVIAGAGALGLYLGGRLIEQGIPVAFLGREVNKESVRHEGITLSSGLGSISHVPAHRVEYDTNPAIIREAHWVWVTVKCQHTNQLCEEIGAFIRPGAKILSLQNGVHNGVWIRNRFPKHSVQSVVVPYNIVSKGHGHFHQASSGTLIVEASHEPSADPVEGLLAKANLKFQVVDYIYPVLWGKLLLNLNNAINALAGVSIKDELAQRDYRLVFSRCLEEALDVYERAGIEMKNPLPVPIQWFPTLLKLPDAFFKLFADVLVRLDEQAFSSMWQDLNAHKKTEIDFINGELLRLADQFQVPVPTIRHIYDLIKSVEVKRAGCPSLSGQDLMPEGSRVA